MELIQGDCLEKMRDMSNNSIDFLFCDLPYCGITNSKKDSEISCKWNTPVDLEKFWKQVNRICKINCPMFFCCSTKFGVSLINSNPKNFRYDIIYIKSASCNFLNAKKMPLKKHELIYVFYRKLPLYDLSSHKHKVLPERKTVDYKNNSFIYGKIDRPDYMRKNGESAYEPSLPNTILEVKSEKGKHATQKPIELIKYLLKYYSKENDVVLDPTMGSGTTGVACKEMNRKFIGIEQDDKIYKVAVERIK
jgi:site-specific DNA-methyltransferase (adenine-specific)